MLSPIKAICERKDIRKDGTSLIFIQYCYSSGHRTLLNTEIAIPPGFWLNRKKKPSIISQQLPVEFGDADALNESIKKMLRLTEDIIELAERNKVVDRANFVKELFKPGGNIAEVSKNLAVAVKTYSTSFDNKFNKELFFQLDDYILSKKNKVSDGTQRVYKQMSNRLKAFEEFRKETVSFESIDYNFYEDFVDYLTFKYKHKRRKQTITGLKVNTIGQTVKQFRIFIKDRTRRKIIAPIDLTDFKILDEETDAIYLNYEEVERIYMTDLTEAPYLVEYRDLFVMACLTGLRFSDFSSLRYEDLRKNFLYKKQFKSDHWVVIPLRTEAMQLFEKQFKDNIPKLTNVEFNRHIKKIGRLAGLNEIIKFSYKKGNKDVQEIKPKYEWITTHTARRSFCTNEFLAGTPVKLIMKISGHKTEKDFYKYIRVTPEEAAGKIQELWMERNNLGAFGNQLRKIS